MAKKTDWVQIAGITGVVVAVGVTAAYVINASTKLAREKTIQSQEKTVRDTAELRVDYSAQCSTEADAYAEQMWAENRWKGTSNKNKKMAEWRAEWYDMCMASIA